MRLKDIMEHDGRIRSPEEALERGDENVVPEPHCRMTPPVIASTTDKMTIVASDAE